MRFSRGGEFEVLDLGRADYGATNERMDLLVDEAALTKGPDRILLAEFNPVLTVGRGGDVASYAECGLPVFEVSLFF